MALYPAVTRLRILTIGLLLLVSACSTGSTAPTSTPVATKAAAILTATSKPTETSAPSATEIATQAPTEKAQATVITFLPPPPGQEVGRNADVKALAADGKLSGGNVNKGEGIYTVLGCIGCHSLTRVAPPTAGTLTRVMDARLKDPLNAGKTPEEFIAESILRPNAYISPSYAEGIMPQDFGTRISLQDLQDLIAFIESVK